MRILIGCGVNNLGYLKDYFPAFEADTSLFKKRRCLYLTHTAYSAPYQECGSEMQIIAAITEPLAVSIYIAIFGEERPFAIQPARR
jgi:hypothetical protein